MVIPNVWCDIGEQRAVMDVNGKKIPVPVR